MKRFIAETVCFYLLACVLLICLFSDDSGSKIKNAEVNDIVFTIKKYYPNVDSAINILQGYETDYIVIGEDGKEVGASRQEILCHYHYAIFAERHINSSIFEKKCTISSKENK